MQNSIDFQLNMLQPTLAMPTNEDHEVISYWNKEVSQFAATRTDRRQGGRGELGDLTGQSDGGREEENYYNLS